MADDGIGAPRTSPRSAATKPNERPSARNDVTQIAKPTNCTASPAVRPHCGCAPTGLNSTPANVPPKARSQSPNFRLTVRAGRRIRYATTTHICSTKNAAPMRRCDCRYTLSVACAKNAAPMAPIRFVAILTSRSARADLNSKSSQCCTVETGRSRRWTNRTGGSAMVSLRLAIWGNVASLYDASG